MVSFRGQKKLGPRPDRSPLGFYSKFPTGIPAPFICESPPGASPAAVRSFQPEPVHRLLLGRAHSTKWF